MTDDAPEESADDRDSDDEGDVDVGFDARELGASADGRGRWRRAFWSAGGAWTASVAFHVLIAAAAGLTWRAHHAASRNSAGSRETVGVVTVSDFAPDEALVPPEATELPEPPEEPVTDSASEQMPALPDASDDVAADDEAFAASESFAEPTETPGIIGLSPDGPTVPTPSARRAPPVQTTTTGTASATAPSQPVAVAEPFTPARAAGGGGGAAGGLDERGLPVPEYPALSRRRREQGLVLLSVEIRADGSVGTVQVLSDPGFPRLVDAATRAVRRAKFQPAFRGDKPVDSVLEIPYRFALDG